MAWVLRFLLFFALFSTANGQKKTLVVSTWGSPGFQEATLKGYKAAEAGSPLYGLVEGLSTCEQLQCESTVGFGGSPDETGETTLDALLFDAPLMRVAAVANLHRIKDAARVAWAVMNYTQHTMLVGESATQFAIAMGFKEENLATNTSQEMYNGWKSNKCQPNFWKNVSPSPNTGCGPYKPSPVSEFASEKTNIVYKDFSDNHDTIGMMVFDLNSRHITAGTSTNGMRNKIPGRVGDSPIPGSGAYALDEVGAAVATGDGDIMMRFLPSYTAVDLMRMHAKPNKAAKTAISRILGKFPKFQGGVVAADVRGRVGAACANMGNFVYTTVANGTLKVNKVLCMTKP